MLMLVKILYCLELTQVTLEDLFDVWSKQTYSSHWIFRKRILTH